MTESEKPAVFIPFEPGYKKRITGTLIQILTVLPVLVSVLMAKPTDPLMAFMRILGYVVVVLIVIAAYKNLKSSSSKWPRYDMTLVFAGFVIIAQCVSIFTVPEKIILSQVMMIIAAGMIFKGVMFPVSKAGIGVTIDNKGITIKRAFFGEKEIFPLEGINGASSSNDLLKLHYINSETAIINLEGFENIQKVCKEINDDLGTEM